MIARKKYVFASLTNRQGAQDSLTCNRSHIGLREVVVKPNDRLDNVEDDFTADDVPLWSEDFGHIQERFMDGEADFWG